MKTVGLPEPVSSRKAVEPGGTMGPFEGFGMDRPDWSPDFDAVNG